MVAAIQHTKLLSMGQDRLQTHLAILVVLPDVGLLLGTALKLLLAALTIVAEPRWARRVQELAAVTVPTMSLHEELTNRLVGILVQKLFN